MPDPKSKAAVEAVKAELTSFIEKFDPDNVEDIELRKDRLITALLEARLIECKGNPRLLRLPDAFKGLLLKVPAKDKLVKQAETFDDLTNSYEGDPLPGDLEHAAQALEEINRMLQPALDKEILARA